VHGYSDGLGLGLSLGLGLALALEQGLILKNIKMPRKTFNRSAKTLK